MGWHGKACALDVHQACLEDYFVDNPPRSTREAQQAIERRTGIRRGLSQVRVFGKYRETEGVKHFTTIEVRRDDKVLVELELSDLQLQEQLGDETFDKP